MKQRTREWAKRKPGEEGQKKEIQENVKIEEK